MSDFLDQLISRAFDPSPTVRPRAISLFEPSVVPQPILADAEDTSPATTTPPVEPPVDMQVGTTPASEAGGVEAVSTPEPHVTPALSQTQPAFKAMATAPDPEPITEHSAWQPASETRDTEKAPPHATSPASQLTPTADPAPVEERQTRVADEVQPTVRQEWPEDSAEHSPEKARSPHPSLPRPRDERSAPSEPQAVVPETAEPSAPTTSLTAIVRQMVLEPARRETVVNPHMFVANSAATDDLPRPGQQPRPASPSQTKAPESLPVRRESQVTSQAELSVPLHQRPSDSADTRSGKQPDRPKVLRPQLDPLVDQAASPRPQSPAVPLRRHSEAPQQTTSVHVTIGRVEVRAVSKQPPNTQKPRPQPVTMSLEDYLAQRSGRG
jgi:hypothetical protein